MPSGRLYKDGSLLISAEARTVAARRRLSFAGMVSVALALNDKGQLMADPEVELIGLPDTDAAGVSMTDIARDAVEEAFETLPKPRRRDPDAVAEAVRRARARPHRRALEQKADLPRACADGIMAPPGMMRARSPAGAGLQETNT